MSVHRSLKSSSGLTRSRNVLTRAERIEALKTAEKWVEGRSVFGLPSMHVVRVKAKPKAEPVAATEGAEAAAGATAEAKAE